MSNPSTAGYVYLIRSDSGHYKIGKAVDAERRAGYFTVQLPFKVEVIKTVECADRHFAERFLHRAFSQFRVNGEWFTLSPLALLYFEYLAGIAAFPAMPSDWSMVYDWSQETVDGLTHEALNDTEKIKGWVRSLLFKDDPENQPSGF